ncbi:hypothetical protein [Nonomuraea sp. SBT364]|uniref:hypothetical protein n=1 Tax=Nonomuraea sp. SBT364 TaxID=1580530 RepID=UPI0012E201AF|nr:hypothetical protein [Nonomuraea sp. SBT364]
MTASLAGAAVLALHLATPTAAGAAAYGCSGTLVGSWKVPMKDALDGSTYYRSDVKLYYNARTGWNCAALVKRKGARYGEKTPMWLEMYNSRWAEDNWKNNYDEDQGRFKYYAGPVKVYGKDICVSIRARHGDHTGPGDDYNGRLDLTGVACR